MAIEKLLFAQRVNSNGFSRCYCPRVVQTVTSRSVSPKLHSRTYFLRQRHHLLSYVFSFSESMQRTAA